MKSVDELDIRIDKTTATLSERKVIYKMHSDVASNCDYSQILLITYSLQLHSATACFVMVRAGARYAYRHLFWRRKKNILYVYFERLSYLRTGTFLEVWEKVFFTYISKGDATEKRKTDSWILQNVE